MFGRLGRLAVIGLWIVGLAAGATAHAHHSSAGVDMTKSITLSGMLKEFDFSAPHAQFIVSSADSKGAAVETRITTLAPTALIKQGFKPKDFKAGQKIQVTYHPNRNGLGGLLMTLTLEDGRVVKGDIY
jgi:hypothetical protein